MNQFADSKTELKYQSHVSCDSASENIRNIVFDLGNVLVTFQPLHFLESRYGRGKALRMFDVFYPELWDRYDQGLLTKEQMIEEGKRKLPDLSAEVENWMNVWTEDVQLIMENVLLLSGLKEAGFNLYVLSNLPEQDYLALKEKGLFDQMDGGVFSYQEKRNKPDPLLYQILADRYHLDPSPTLFIDDRKENIETALRIGWQAIHLENPLELKEQVLKLNLLSV